MNQHGYLVYGERLSDSYCGCDAYGYKYNEICEKYLHEPDDYSDDTTAYLSWSAAEKCYKECRKHNIPVNIIYCQVADDDKTAVAESSKSECRMIFLGFDVAWKEYDFYSSVYHDIISEYGVLNNQYERLNRYGLFSKYAQAEEYLKLRKSLKDKRDDGRFEEGDFFIVGIWKHDDPDMN